MKSLLPIFALCLMTVSASTVAFAAKALPYFSSKDLTPYWNKDGATNTPATFGNFNLVDQNQQALTKNQVTGKAFVVNFFFTSCRAICPLLMQTLQGFQAKVHKNAPQSTLQMLSFSTMPETDSPRQLKTYAKVHHLDLSHWSLLTGAPQEIEKLGRLVFQKTGPSPARNPDEPLFEHSSNVYLVDSQWRIRGAYDANNPKQLDLLAQDLSTLENE